MDTLKGQCASSDDSDNGADTGVTRYLRVKPMWRSLKLENFLVHLDALERSARQAFGGGTRRRQGAPRRIREPSTKVNNESVVPKGLPANCYDSEWIAKLSTFQKLRLHVKEDHDFSFPDGYEVN